MDYQELKNIAFKTARDVKRTSENLYNSAKISVQISKKETEIEDRYVEIGKLIYEAHSGNDTNGHRVSALCDEIDGIIEEISALKQKKELVKTLHKCPSCGCAVNAESEFCPNCGCEL